MPHCALCDDKAWHGWVHERENWLWFPFCHEAMVKAHYRWDCARTERDFDYIVVRCEE